MKNILTAEQKELLVYTKDHFEKELNSITINSVSPLICIRKIVKKAIIQYLKDYCSYTGNIENNTVFSDSDFKIVCDALCKEL